MARLDRNRTELSRFLRSRRERITPEEVGLHSTGRRRTPGLRREEVAALAGVGITWYTWLEQGRAIGVSTKFLDAVCRVLKLDAAERRHLYMLTQQRPPVEPGRSSCEVPSIARRLVGQLPESPTYVLNLKWDALLWNKPADRLFGFAGVPSEERNMLWLVFNSELIRSILDPWEDQAREIVSSFKRDYAQAPQDAEMLHLINQLCTMDGQFRDWWRRPEINGPCTGSRSFTLPSAGRVTLAHTLLTFENNKNLRIAYYTAQEEDSPKFRAWLRADGLAGLRPSPASRVVGGLRSAG